MCFVVWPLISGYEISGSVVNFDLFDNGIIVVSNKELSVSHGQGL